MLAELEETGISQSHLGNKCNQSGVHHHPQVLIALARASSLSIRKSGDKQSQKAATLGLSGIHVLSCVVTCAAERTSCGPRSPGTVSAARCRDNQTRQSSEQFIALGASWPGSTALEQPLIHEMSILCMPYDI